MTTVADMVIEQPGVARVFERYGIDYCCHGQRPLAEACAEAGVDPAMVAAELAATESVVHETPGVAHAPTVSGPAALGALIGHIVATHHTYLRRELPRLAELMDKVIAAHGTVHPEVHVVAGTLHAISDELMPHLLKEERVLFPLVIELIGAVRLPEFHCGSAANPIRVMRLEHDAVGDLLAQLRHQTDTYRVPADACPTWRALYAGLADLEADVHQHVHLENNVLFPRIEDLEASLR